MKTAVNDFNYSSKLNKNIKIFFGTLTIAVASLTSCSSNDDNAILDPQSVNVPSAQDFANIRSQALSDITQNFQFNADDGMIFLTSNKGVAISIDANCLTKNGNPVSGMVDLEYVEVFEKGNMLTTNKTTMGIKSNGNKALIITGGEFFLEATQNGDVLDTGCAMQLEVPTALTGGPDPDMTLWTGNIDSNGDLIWDPQTLNGHGVFVSGSNYSAFLQNFGWTNIDKFYLDPRPKTTIHAQAPADYNYNNSAIYLAYANEDFGLAILTEFENGVFSEYYGELPIGLDYHLIFTTEVDGEWRYAVKSATLAEDQIITFSIEETTIATTDQLVSIVNALP